MRGARIQGIIGGLFDNPNDLALHFVTMIPIAFTSVLASRNLLKKMFYGISAFLMMAGVVATFSRGGFLGLTCALGVLMWKLMGRNRWLIGVALPVAAMIFLLFTPGGYVGRLVGTDDGSAIARADDLKRSIFVAAHHPVFGVGMDNYLAYSNNNLASHNAYTQVASELGLAALVLYVMFMITPLKQLRRIGREIGATGKRDRFFYLAAGLEASIIGYMVCSFFASVAYLWYVYYLVAYAVCVRRLYETRSDTRASAIGSATQSERV